ncbi:LLM class F420-dependent oxidoreductase [Williamsia soli]|uniref:LLM class F420-dependent oxidoreductase n=1 Tax=Williamsia soli TaxID=364929 RepID=UPI001A9D934A|nr:LLM class F420-dependent oxidoreductase [Williamsia soli]
MKTGVMTMNTDEYGISPLDMARLVEDSGLESLWMPDHSHVPVGGAIAEEDKALYGGGEEREERFKVSPGHLPREYYRNYDQLTTIAAMGAVTSTLKLGTGICLVVQREPLFLAKQVATIDQFTNGRLIFGVGAGAPWNRGELENHGVALKTRTDMMLERIDAMKQIWSEDRAEFHGEHVDFDPIFSWPKPITTPHPQIMMGGMGPSVLDRVLSHADGWFPGHIDGGLDELGDRITELRERAASLGRTVDVSINFCRLEFIEQYAAMKPDRVVFMIPALISGDEKRKFIQELGALAPQLADSASAVA